MKSGNLQFQSDSRSGTSSKNIDKLFIETKINGHENDIRDLSYFEKEGKTYIISASEDKSVKIWDLTNPENVVMTGNLSTSFPVYCTSIFSIDSRYFLASVGRDSTIEVWNLEDKTLDYTLNDSSGSKFYSCSIFALTNYESNGNHFIISSSDNNIKIWDTLSNTCVHKFEEHFDRIYSLEIYNNKGKKILASGSMDHTVKLWDLDNKCCITTLTDYLGGIYSIKVFYKEEKFYLGSGNVFGMINIWNLSNYQLEKTIDGHINDITSMALIPLKIPCLLTRGISGNMIKIWDLGNYTLLKIVDAPSYPCSFTSFN